MKKPRCPVCGGPVRMTPDLARKTMTISCNAGTGCVARVVLQDDRRGPGMPVAIYLRRLARWFYALDPKVQREWAIVQCPPPDVVFE